VNPKPLEFADGVLRIVDQSKIPLAVEVVELRSWREVADAVAAMKIRGAPAIGIAGAYGVALAARCSARPKVANPGERSSPADFLAELQQAGDALAAVRPTAVNLSWAVSEMMDEARRRFEAGETPAMVVAALEAKARAIHDDDERTCRAIGAAGAALLPDAASVLTHCNTGDFATGGYGTALGIIRSAWHAGRLARVFVDETRPLLQGSRLTTFELQHDGIPFTLIADTMPAHFMARGDVDAVVVGADRIARNGDVANKIGTYALAILAKEHRIPFIVAAPRSTFDASIADGSAIIIEERDAREITHVAGVPVAAPGTRAANPAFDVTPARLIHAIVTEAGVLRAPYERSIPELMMRSPEREAAR